MIGSAPTSIITRSSSPTTRPSRTLARTATTTVSPRSQLAPRRASFSTSTPGPSARSGSSRSGPWEDGKLVTLELEKKHAKVAHDQENIDHAGLTSKVNIIVGPAVESLKAIPTEPQFDLTFIDADKENNTAYFIEAERLVRKGGVIIVDNVVRRGRVADPNNTDPSTLGVRKLLKYLKDNKNIEATTIGTVGEKGWDGFTYAIRL